MLNLKKIRLGAGLFIITVLVSGCSINFQTSDSQNKTDGGLYKSVNSGTVWKQQTLIATVTGSPLNFNQANVTAITLDPQDKNAVYAGVTGGGLLYSYDAGASWTLAKTLGKRNIADIAVSPRNKCSIYVASENKIFHSNDCSRSWQELYFDNSPKVIIYNLAIDPKEDKIIYAGTSRGEVIMSADYGESWAALTRFAEDNNAVIKVAIDKNNPNNLWAATVTNGVYRSNDRGKNWSGSVEQLMEIHTRDAIKITDLAVAASDGKTVVIATKAGLIRTVDGGNRWQVMELVPPADKTAINAVAIHPSDSSLIYYVTNTSFGFTKDGGKTWASKKLPTSRTGLVLTVDPADPDILYLGTYLIEKK
jgi:photosystem II stability/assembly factor-like uncharacterized protein